MEKFKMSNEALRKMTEQYRRAKQEQMYVNHCPDCGFEWRTNQEPGTEKGPVGLCPQCEQENICSDDQAHRIEAYRDLRQRLLNTRAKEQWQMQEAQDRGQRAEAIRRLTRLAMLCEVIEVIEDLAGL